MDPLTHFALAVLLTLAGGRLVRWRRRRNLVTVVWRG
jgi:hypothetical protein